MGESDGNLRTRLLLLLLPQGQEGNVGDLDNLELDTGNVTLGTTLVTESSDQDFVIDLNKVQATVVGNKSSDLLRVLDQLDTDGFTNGRVWLFGFNTPRMVEKERERV